MPFGYRSSKSSYRSGGTSAWNTSGETASVRNACAQYGLTEAQVANANPPIPCQWRSCHGNSYAVVKLSDIAALKRRLLDQAKEERKRALIEELGEEGYKAKIEADAAAKEAKQKMEAATKKLVSSLEAAIAASGSGIASSTLEGMTISKTAAKSEWYVKPEELERLSPVDPSKSQKKYHLADVIRVAHEKTGYSVKGDHISKRVKAFPARQKLYARYLHDIFEATRKEVDDETVVKAACDSVRGKIQEEVDTKAAVAKKAQEELKLEQNRLAAFDGLVEDMQSDSSGNEKKRPANTTAAKKNAEGSNAVDENTENDSKKPAAKKQKSTKKKGLAPSSEEVAVSAGRTGSRKRNNAVSYAEADTEDEEEG